MTEFFFFFSSRRRHTRYWRDWSSDVCSSDLLGDRGDVVGDVAQVAAQVLVDAVLVEAGSDRVEDAGERLGGALELQHLLRELVDAPRDAGVAAEDLGLDLVDVRGQPRDHRRVRSEA